jgi:hypothetical protein
VAYQRLKDASAPPRSYGQRLELAEGKSQRGLPCRFTDKAGSMYSEPLYLTGFSCPTATASRRRGQRPVHHVQVPATNKERRRGQRPGHRDLVPARRRGHRPGHHDEIPATHNKVTVWTPRSSTCDAQRGKYPGTTTKYLRQTTSGAAGYSLGTAIKYLRGAARIGLGTTVKRLRRTTRQRSGHHDQVPATHSERRRGQRPGHQDQVPVTHNKRRRGQRSGPIPGVTYLPIHHKRPFFAFRRAPVANKQKSTSFSRSGYTRARHRYFLFLVPNWHTKFLTFHRSISLFSFACSPPPGSFFARDYAHAGGPVR